MYQLLVFFGCWGFGATVLFFWLKNQNKSLRFNDVLVTAILSGIIGIVFSFAAWKANLWHWFTCIAFAGLSAYISNKLLDKAK